MSNKQAVLARIESELKDSPQQLNSILSQWEGADESAAANQNLKELPEAALQAAQNIATFQSFIGLPAYYNYDNYIIQSHNTCGQAVIGSFVDFYNKNPFNLPKNVPGNDGRMHFDNMSFIGNIFHQFGPNYPLPNGVTVRETIIAACTTYGLKCNEYYPGAYSNGLDSKAELTGWIQKYNKPVAALVDTGTNIFNKPQNFTLHWCTVYAYDADYVYIATWADSKKVSWDMFMQAWHCWWLPYPNNYYQLRVWDF